MARASSPCLPKYLVFQARNAPSSVQERSSSRPCCSRDASSDIRRNDREVRILLQMRFCQVGDVGKRIRVVHRQVGEGLAIELNLSTLQAVNEFTVPKATHAAGRAQTNDPEPAEHPLAHPTVAEGIDPSSN